jgi:hypothetical protein
MNTYTEKIFLIPFITLKSSYPTAGSEGQLEYKYYRELKEAMK